MRIRPLPSIFTGMARSRIACLMGCSCRSRTGLNAPVPRGLQRRLTQDSNPLPHHPTANEHRSQYGGCGAISQEKTCSHIYDMVDYGRGACTAFKKKYFAVGSILSTQKATKRAVWKGYWKHKAAGLCRRCGRKPLLGKTRCRRCHAEHLEYGRAFKDQAIASGKCRYCGWRAKLASKSMCGSCLEKHAKRNATRYAELRRKCLDAYGGACTCCGTAVSKYLQLDHKNNDGANHRRLIHGIERGGSIYPWAVRNGFPELLHLLCANCHQAKTTSGGCRPEDHATDILSKRLGTSALKPQKRYKARSLSNKWSMVPNNKGYIIKLATGFSYRDFRRCVAKYVRENHVRTDEHWKSKPMIKNGLANGLET